MKRKMSTDERRQEAASPCSDRGAHGGSCRRAAPVTALHQAVGNSGVKELHERGELQPSLAVSQPGDPAEREAERIADMVIRQDQPTPERPVDRVGGRPSRREAVEAADRRADEETPPTPTSDMCPRCIRRHRSGKPLDCEECEQAIQRAVASLEQAPGVRGGAATETPGGRSDTPSSTGGGRQASIPAGGGRPLRDGARSFFEQRFGRDFGDVRIYADSRADRAAASLNARAFTMGSDIYFRSSEYNPESQQGKHLLAHELTHVVQQRDSGQLLLQRQWAGESETEETEGEGYEETTEPAKPTLAEKLGYPITPASIECLNDLYDPLKKITFERWIPQACEYVDRSFLHSREWDAFGHCWIACEGTRKCGRGATLVLGRAREWKRELDRDPHDSYDQDNNNQDLGRALAGESGTCFSLCYGAYKSLALDLSAPERNYYDCIDKDIVENKSELTDSSSGGRFSGP